MPFKTLHKDQYTGSTDPYTLNYSHRNIRNKDPRVVLNYADELRGDSYLQVAPHSRRYIKPENLLAAKTPNPYDLDRLSLGPPSGVEARSRNFQESNIKESNTSSQLVKDIREANKMRMSKLEEYEEHQRQLSNYRDLKIKKDLAKREAELHAAVETDQIIKSAKKDLSRLKNVDRPLYDLLLTNGSGFKGDQQTIVSAAYNDRSLRKGTNPSSALPITPENDHFIGDVPRLIPTNLEESSFMTADQTRIQELLI